VLSDRPQIPERFWLDLTMVSNLPPWDFAESVMEGGGVSMRLVKAAIVERTAQAGQDAIDQLRDVGSRLDYVLDRYASLVSDLGASGGHVADLNARLDLVASQLGYVARRLQDMVVTRHEARVPKSASA
jgi:hypothetical protein